MRWQLTFESADRHQDPLIGERNKKKAQFSPSAPIKKCFNARFSRFWDAYRSRNTNWPAAGLSQARDAS